MGGPASASRFWLIAVLVAIAVAIAVNVAVALLTDEEKGSRPPPRERPAEQLAR